ncbi:hypothetical protein B5M47_02920 [candidate division CPR3 bacterium 4484_211]|uniref:EamA domain-containing protein n=1 Tax=candidate division CPR3 bacterium 4484_211 TaxID=1968527 RepID=A0A1W9NXF6_UNCC3|nr:MAG: hypothetical protein B5M47_02920 [candidate division CPR3 bacterium 4484_211]
MPNPYAWFFWYFLIYFCLGLFLPLFNPIKVIPADIKQLSFILPYTIPIFIGIFCFSHALYKLDVTTMGPLFNLGNVFTPLLAFFVLGEKIPFQNIPWLILIVIAGFFAVYDERLKFKSFLNKYVYVFLLWVFCLSITRIAANRGTNALGFWNFTFYEFFYGSIGLLFFLPFIYKKIKVEIKPILFMIPAVVLEFFGLLLILKAFSYQVVVPAIVNSMPLGSVVAFALSRSNKRLLEYHPLKTYAIRFLGIFLMTVGLIRLAIG